MRGLATLPPGWIQEPSVVRDRDGRPPRGPLAVHCFCVCSGSALLGDHLGVSRSRERDLLSVQSIYPRYFFCVFIVYCRVLFSCMLMSVDCFGLVVSTCVWPHLFCGACWSWEKEGRAVEVVPGIYAVQWKFSMCTATRTSSYSPLGLSVFFVCIFSLGLCFACLFVLFRLDAIA